MFSPRSVRNPSVSAWWMFARSISSPKNMTQAQINIRRSIFLMILSSSLQVHRDRGSKRWMFSLHYVSNAVLPSISVSKVNISPIARRLVLRRDIRIIKDTGLSNVRSSFIDQKRDTYLGGSIVRIIGVVSFFPYELTMLPRLSERQSLNRVCSRIL